ncbi:MAG: hypothetical protein JXB30_12145, partial [Anaerolineae bacterium]|nr:hypothetical protein [Anaerolineae bacterium]
MADAGLKGSFAEAQWFNMGIQLYPALLNKARRGDLAVRLPVGYERLETGKVITHRLPLDEWPVLNQDAFPAYINWEQYSTTNADWRRMPWGLIGRKARPDQARRCCKASFFCVRCGWALHTRSEHSPGYACHGANQQYGEAYCRHFSAPHIDNAVVDLFSQAIEPAHLDIALAAAELERLWKEK